MIAPEPGRPYRTLDGLRGVAALAVVTRHVGRVFPSDFFPQSFLAVDLFFLISGFVIAHAYGARLRAGGSIGGFMKARLIRLYPLYAAGLTLGAAAHLAATLTGGQTDWTWLMQAGALGLLMAPAIPGLPMGGSALDGPTWTLGPELLVNLIYAVSVRRLSLSWLAAIVVVAGIALVGSEAIYGSLDGGWSAGTWPLLAARIGFSFFLGVLLQRLPASRRTGRAVAWGCVAAVALILTVHPPAALTHIYELGAVTLAFPLVIFVAVRVEPGGFSGELLGGLGLASYAVYVLHQPLGAFVGGAMSRLHIDGPAPVKAVLFIMAVVAFSLVLDRVYDTPVRRWLSGLRLGGSPRRARMGVHAHRPGPDSSQLRGSAGR